MLDWDVLNVNELVGSFNQEKALVGTFCVNTKHHIVFVSSSSRYLSLSTALLCVNY